jgi:glycosyltransferase involved in cell wall biosynthesis
MQAMESAAERPVVSVIVPARNEEVCLGNCLESLVAQTGVAFEIIVVDDHSTDRTREIAASFAGVRVIDARPLPEGWTGKNNAVFTGAREARGEWLLFTDADTVHLPGSLAGALKEARENGAELLSYSPEQIAVTFWEMATLPVVFAELARQYSPSKVSDPASSIAAANGQYILIRRDTYDAVGGHAAVAGNILEDVALARAVKSSGRRIRFRYAADAVRTRMYRNYAQLRDGWTKNLALLFPRPGWLALKTLALWVTPWVALFVIRVAPRPHWWWNSIFVGSLLLLANRLRRANFTWDMEILGSFFGMPMFAYLLLRSKRAHAKGSVGWKGRTYSGADRTGKDCGGSGTTLMKLAAFLILPTLLFAGPIQTDSRQESGSFTSREVIIEPGSSVGPLKLGDTQEHALELFPKKAEDQQWENSCGTTFNWVDSDNQVRGGNVFIRTKKGKVFQIESATTRFHTAEGIASLDPPEKVANAYKDLRAFALLTPPVAALGDRPLIFWVDKKKGVAFSFAYYPAQHKRYLYEIIVFVPNKTFCPQEETTASPKWQEIPAYSLELPADLAG